MFELPRAATRILSVLEGAGHEAWVVGGWVRDAVMGLPDHDVDVTTDARWQQVAAACRAAGIPVHETGTAHGTVTCVVDGAPVVVTTYGVEGAYSDARNPDSVEFVGSVELDLARRDLTVNAMAYHPARGLLDPYGGVSDIASRTVRCVGEPAARLAEDALRVLRAVRFACRLGFAIEPATQAALVAAAPELSRIASERVGAELSGILSSGRAAWALMREPEVMLAALPELAPMRGLDQRNPHHAYDVYGHTARTVAGVECFCGGVVAPELAWAALLHDVGKPSCLSVDEGGVGHFYGHPKAGAELARGVLRRLAIPGEVAAPAVALVRHHDRPVIPDARPVRRLLARLDAACPGRAVPLAHMLMELKRADAWARRPFGAEGIGWVDEVEAALRRELRADAAFRVRDLAVSGRDVMGELGLEPGPEVGRVLAAALDAVMAGEVANEREALLEWMGTGR